MASSLSREEVLDELEFLATVEHALVVEYLSVFCALGHDLEADEGGATTDEGRNAASAASTLAMDEMFRLKNISFGLVDAGRFAQLGRADSISSDAAAAPPSSAPADPRYRSSRSGCSTGTGRPRARTDRAWRLNARNRGCVSTNTQHVVVILGNPSVRAAHVERLARTHRSKT